VRRALARWQDLIAIADTGARSNRKYFFFARPSPAVNAPQADGDGLECHRHIRQHTSAYVSIRQIVLALRMPSPHSMHEAGRRQDNRFGSVRDG
jgi:hypothetical protein